jgi:hypothetical protein
VRRRWARPKTVVLDASPEPGSCSTHLADGALAGGTSRVHSGGTGGAFALTVDNGIGLVTLLDSLFGPVSGVTGTGVLASVSFTALAPGTTSGDLSNLIFENSVGGGIRAQTVSGRVDVSSALAPVPEPASFLLLGSALAAGAIRKAATRLRPTTRT